MLTATALTSADRQALHQAVQRLENPSLAARLTSALGTPFEYSLGMLPPALQERVQAAAEASIRKALDTAITSLSTRPGLWSCKALGIASGAVGGWFGAPALLVELPVSTVIMLRAIAQIAAVEGEDLEHLESRLACLEVFALGGRSRSDDAAETGYYGMRLALAMHLSGVIRGGGGAAGSAAVARFVQAVAQRFGVVVSHKAALGMVPMISAVSGAAINGVFVQHFEDMARGHFTVRRLERCYGAECIEQEYRSLAARQVR